MINHSHGKPYTYLSILMFAWRSTNRCLSTSQYQAPLTDWPLNPLLGLSSSSASATANTPAELVTYPTEWCDATTGWEFAAQQDPQGVEIATASWAYDVMRGLALESFDPLAYQRLRAVEAAFPMDIGFNNLYSIGTGTVFSVPPQNMERGLDNSLDVGLGFPVPFYCVYGQDEDAELGAESLAGQLLCPVETAFPMDNGLNNPQSISTGVLFSSQNTERSLNNSLHIGQGSSDQSYCPYGQEEDAGLDVFLTVSRTSNNNENAQSWEDSEFESSCSSSQATFDSQSTPCSPFSVFGTPASVATPSQSAPSSPGPSANIASPESETHSQQPFRKPTKKRATHATPGNRKEYLCPYSGCERGIPGNGFKNGRADNMRNHRRLVHHEMIAKGTAGRKPKRAVMRP